MYRRQLCKGTLRYFPLRQYHYRSQTLNIKDISCSTGYGTGNYAGGTGNASYDRSEVKDIGSGKERSNEEHSQNRETKVRKPSEEIGGRFSGGIAGRLRRSTTGKEEKRNLENKQSN